MEKTERMQSVKTQQFKNRYLNKRFLFSLVWKFFRLVIILGLCYIILYPFFIKAVNAFKSSMDFADPSVRFIPRYPTTENIKRVWESMNYMTAFFNTLALSLVTALLQTIVGAFAGYGFARFKFKGSGFFFMLVILTLLVPPQVLMMPLFRGFNAVGMTDSLLPSIILSATGMGLRNGLYIFMFRQYFRNVPRELEEAAYIDGCGTLKTFIRVIAPAATAIATTVFLLSFSWQWTDTFYSDLFYMDMPILSKAVMNIGDPYVGLSNSDPILTSAMVATGSLLAILPLGVLYVFAQRLFVQSVERSGIVG